MRVSRTMIPAALGLLLAATLHPAGAQAPLGRLTLDEAVALAARANPTLRAKQFEYRAIGANEITAGLRPNPTATYLAEQFGGGSAALVQHTFSIGQPIELGGKRQRRLESARAATRVTGHELEDVRRQIVFQVKKAFTDALVAREALDLTEQNGTSPSSSCCASRSSASRSSGTRPTRARPCAWPGSRCARRPTPRTSRRTSRWSASWRIATWPPRRPTCTGGRSTPGRT